VGSEMGIRDRDRILLFCIEEKCMSGRVNRVRILDDEKYEIEVTFIEASYFSEELVVGQTIRVQESSKVIAKGKIVDVISAH